MLRYIGSRAAALTLLSNWCADILEPAFGPGPVYELLPPGIDHHAYNTDVSGKAVRETLGLGDDPVVLCVSRVVKRKGQDTLVGILPELRRRVPGTRLVIVGDGSFMPRLREMVEQLELTEVVTITGKVPEEDLPAHFAASDVFAMPCRERKGGLEVEAFGIVFIQAEAVGVPVVAGDIGGVPDSLIDGETGYLVDSSDPGAVLERLVELLEDSEKRRTMGEAAARFVSSGFTWERRTAELRTLLERVVSPDRVPT